WKLEVLCNEFAERLLIPEQFTSRAIDSVHDAVSMSRSIIGISEATATSLEVASRRLVACIDHAAAVAQVNIDDDRHVSIVWSVENMPWLACARGTLLGSDHPLRCVIISGLTLPLSSCRAIQLNGVHHACMRRDNARQVTIYALPE